jgi:hypothetical protein
MRRTLIVSIALFASVALAQDIGATIRGVYGATYGSDLTVAIPGYGVHAFVQLSTSSDRIDPEQARDIALPIFVALATARGGTISVSVHARMESERTDYVLLFQMVDGVTRVYLDGEPFDR